jgi:GNAT superfamily N-acetyltransferase
MEYRAVTPQNRSDINAFIEEHWYGTQMIVHGEAVDMTRLDGVAAYDGEVLTGLITYRIEAGECEIMSLDSDREGAGIGTALVDQVIRIAGERHCHLIKVTTTNDNIHAIRFYQRRGFDMARIYRNAVTEARRIKPSIPLTGYDGIPLKHEIEFERGVGSDR